MALIISKSSKCVLCGNVIGSSEDAIAFPAFIPRGHELAEFSDSVFHRDCFMQWEKHEELDALYRRYQEIWNLRPPNVTLREAEEWGKAAFDELFRSPAT